LPRRCDTAAADDHDQRPQALQSGNELVAISGRVINPTDREQPVPPIIAELRDKQSKRVVHRWTIPPPARAAPRTSASFNSAEVDRADRRRRADGDAWRIVR
jgi:hypothetical protein